MNLFLLSLFLRVHRLNDILQYFYYSYVLNKFIKNNPNSLQIDHKQIKQYKCQLKIIL